MTANNKIINSDNANYPRVGMLAKIRNRRGIIASVDPFDTKPEGRLHLVRVEYTESDGVPEDTVIWEREHGAVVLEPTELPRVSDKPAMPVSDFDALVRATRWNAITPFLSPNDPETVSTIPIASPFFGAVQVEDFQLIPLLKALQMPRVSLLLADDVGLGKTIEAGLILTELLIRRRIRRVLILCPASLRHQWQQEMKDKFALGFDMIDRPETHSLQKRLGLDANPWRTFPRIIASYHYLRQPDILEQFLATCRQPEGLSQLPWDMLIVDEAHNLMPSNFGEDSDLSQMLRIISPYFEHKLFLTATPHNGHTRCFSGLLEQLDPVRFTQTSEFTQEARARIEDIVLRRLKREINELDDNLHRPRRFAERFLEPLPLFFRRAETNLSQAFQRFHRAVKSVIASAEKGDQIAGTFAIEVLNKRLLSCPSTFAESWYRFKQGLKEEEAANYTEVSAAKRASEEEIDDDREREGRAQHAAKTVGAWLKPLVDRLKDEIEELDAALAKLGIHPRENGLSYPIEDARLERLIAVVKKYVRKGDKWANNERLIVFTEYKTTLDYLDKRLREEFKDDRQAIKTLFGGGMGQTERDDIKLAFNDPNDSIRVLIATDAASEGLNLQETAHLLLHYEVPWNPSRLEQRNGRLDRHGQARDITVFHFTSDDDADLKFLGHIVNKVHTIREDLGSMGEVFDAAFQRRFMDMEDTDIVVNNLDADVSRSQGRASIPRHTVNPIRSEETEKLEELCRELDLSPETLRYTLETALGIGIGQPRFEGPDQRGRLKLKHPLPPRWEALIDDTLRIETPDANRALPGVIFDPKLFVQTNDGRPVFRPVKDTTLLHLGHPMFRQTLAIFARARFPGGYDEIAASRWTVRYGKTPAEVDAVLLLTVEELAVNELREPFHHWIRTLRLPIKNGEIGSPLPHIAPADDRPTARKPDEQAVHRAQEICEDALFDMKPFLNRLSQELTEFVRNQLKSTGKNATEKEKELFKNRLIEVERAMRETSLKKLEKERDDLIADLKKGTLFIEISREKEEALRNLEDELNRRRNHYQELLEQLKKDESRVIERMLPKRYTLRGVVQVFPVAIEIRLPEAVQ